MPPPGLEKMRLGQKNRGFLGAGPERKPENMENSWDLIGISRDLIGISRDLIGISSDFMVFNWDFSEMFLCFFTKQLDLFGCWQHGGFNPQEMAFR